MKLPLINLPWEVVSHQPNRHCCANFETSRAGLILVRSTQKTSWNTGIYRYTYIYNDIYKVWNRINESTHVIMMRYIVIDNQMTWKQFIFTKKIYGRYNYICYMYILHMWTIWKTIIFPSPHLSIHQGEKTRFFLSKRSGGTWPLMALWSCCWWSSFCSCCRPIPDVVGF